MDAGKRKGEEEEPKTKKNRRRTRAEKRKQQKRPRPMPPNPRFPNPGPPCSPFCPSTLPSQRKISPVCPPQQPETRPGLGVWGWGTCGIPTHTADLYATHLKTLLTLPSLPSPVSAHPHPRVSNPRVSLRIESENPKKPPGAEPIAWGEISSSPDNPNALPRPTGNKRKRE